MVGNLPGTAARCGRGHISAGGAVGVFRPIFAPPGGIPPVPRAHPLERPRAPRRSTYHLTRTISGVVVGGCGPGDLFCGETWLTGAEPTCAGYVIWFHCLVDFHA